MGTDARKREEARRAFLAAQARREGKQVREAIAEDPDIVRMGRSSLAGLGDLLTKFKTTPMVGSLPSSPPSPTTLPHGYFGDETPPPPPFSFSEGRRQASAEAFDLFLDLTTAMPEAGTTVTGRDPGEIPQTPTLKRFVDPVTGEAKGSGLGAVNPFRGSAAYFATRERSPESVQAIEEFRQGQMPFREFLDTLREEHEKRSVSEQIATGAFWDPFSTFLPGGIGYKGIKAGVKGAPRIAGALDQGVLRGLGADVSRAVRKTGDLEWSDLYPEQAFGKIAGKPDPSEPLAMGLHIPEEVIAKQRETDVGGTGWGGLFERMTEALPTSRYKADEAWVKAFEEDAKIRDRKRRYGLDYTEFEEPYPYSTATEGERPTLFDPEDYIGAPIPKEALLQEEIVEEALGFGPIKPSAFGPIDPELGPGPISRYASDKSIADGMFETAVRQSTENPEVPYFFGLTLEDIDHIAIARGTTFGKLFGEIARRVDPESIRTIKIRQEQYPVEGIGEPVPPDSDWWMRWGEDVWTEEGLDGLGDFLAEAKAQRDIPDWDTKAIEALKKEILDPDIPFDAKPIVEGIRADTIKQDYGISATYHQGYTAGQKYTDAYLERLPQEASDFYRRYASEDMGLVTLSSIYKKLGALKGGVISKWKGRDIAEFGIKGGDEYVELKSTLSPTLRPHPEEAIELLDILRNKLEYPDPRLALRAEDMNPIRTKDYGLKVDYVGGSRTQFLDEIDKESYVFTVSLIDRSPIFPRQLGSREFPGVELGQQVQGRELLEISFFEDAVQRPGPLKGYTDSDALRVRISLPNEQEYYAGYDIKGHLHPHTGVGAFRIDSAKQGPHALQYGIQEVLVREGLSEDDLLKIIGEAVEVYSGSEWSVFRGKVKNIKPFMSRDVGFRTGRDRSRGFDIEPTSPSRRRRWGDMIPERMIDSISLSEIQSGNIPAKKLASLLPHLMRVYDDLANFMASRGVQLPERLGSTTDYRRFLHETRFLEEEMNADVAELLYEIAEAKPELFRRGSGDIHPDDFPPLTLEELVQVPFIDIIEFGAMRDIGGKTGFKTISEARDFVNDVKTAYFIEPNIDINISYREYLTGVRRGDPKFARFADTFPIELPSRGAIDEDLIPESPEALLKRGTQYRLGPSPDDTGIPGKVNGTTEIPDQPYYSVKDLRDQTPPPRPIESVYSTEDLQREAGRRGITVEQLKARLPDELGTLPQDPEVRRVTPTEYETKTGSHPNVPRKPNTPTSGAMGGGTRGRGGTGGNDRPPEGPSFSEIFENEFKANGLIAEHRGIASYLHNIFKSQLRKAQREVDRFTAEGQEGLRKLGLIRRGKLQEGLRFDYPPPGPKREESLNKLKAIHVAVHTRNKTELEQNYPELVEHYDNLRRRMDEEEFNTLYSDDLNLDEATRAEKIQELQESIAWGNSTEAYFYRGWKTPDWITIIENYIKKYNISEVDRIAIVTGNASPELMSRHGKKIQRWLARSEVAEEDKVSEYPENLMKELESFQFPKADATFEDMLELGFEPLSWNPYQQLRIRINMGKRHRLYNAYIEFLLKRELAIKGSDWRPDRHYAWRIPALGKIWDGTPPPLTDLRSQESGDFISLQAKQDMSDGYWTNPITNERWKVPKYQISKLEDATTRNTRAMTNSIYVRDDIADMLENEFGVMSTGGTLREEFGEQGVLFMQREKGIEYTPSSSSEIKRLGSQLVRKGITAEINTPAPDWFAIRRLKTFTVHDGLTNITQPLKLLKLFGSPFQAFDMLYTSYGPHVLASLDILAKGMRYRNYQSPRLAKLADFMPSRTRALTDRPLGFTDTIVNATVDSGRAFKAMINKKTREDLLERAFGEEGKRPLTAFNDSNPRSDRPGSSGQGITMENVYMAGINLGGDQFWLREGPEFSGLLSQLDADLKSAGFRQAYGKAQQHFLEVNELMRNGLFNGVYPQAMMSVVRINKAHEIVQAFPEYTDAQICAKIAHDINIMFRVTPHHFSRMQSPLLRWMVQNMFAFAPGEYENMTRLFVSAGRGLTVPVKEGIRRTPPLRKAIAKIPGPGGRMAAERSEESAMLDRGGKIALNTVMGQIMYYAILAETIHFGGTQIERIVSGEGIDPKEGHLPFARFNPVRKRWFSAGNALDWESFIPFEMNPDFLTADIPLAKGRNGTNVQLNTLMNWDFILRTLEPNSFISNRQPVLMAAIRNFAMKRNYYGRPNEDYSSRTRQFLIDIGVPIQAQHAALGIARAFDFGWEDKIGPSGRGGKAAPLLNMSGAGMFNVESSQEMRDRRAVEMFGTGREDRRYRPDLPAEVEGGGRGRSYNDLNPFQKLLVDWAVPIDIFGASRYRDLEPYQQDDISNSLDAELSQRNLEQSKLIQREGVNIWAERLPLIDARDSAFTLVTSILEGNPLKEHPLFDPNTPYLDRNGNASSALREMFQTAQSKFYEGQSEIYKKMEYETQDTSPHAGRQALIEYRNLRDKYPEEMTQTQLFAYTAEQDNFLRSSDLSYDDAFYVWRNLHLEAEMVIHFWGPKAESPKKGSIWTKLFSRRQRANYEESVEARKHHIDGTIWKRPK